MVRRLRIILLAGLVSPAAADIIYQTNTPYIGINGPPAFTLSDEQSVALRFTPDRDYTLDSLSVWIISDDQLEISHAPVRVDLRSSGPDGLRPASVSIEEMQFTVDALGWNPYLESVQSRLHPFLHAGRDYWIVLSCDLHNNCPGWNWSDGSTGIIALSYGGQINFNVGGDGAVTATTIEGTTACYANCDQSSAPPLLNINDFQCFLNAFAAGDPYANCDDSTSAPILNVNDFVCFVNAFAVGCP
jgi:hypothetical protein